MKKICLGVLFLNLLVVDFSAATDMNKKFIEDVRTYWDEYYKNQKEAEAFIKKTSQEALDDVLAGKFNVDATIAKIKNMPEELWPCVKEETLILLAKNVRSNVNLEDYYSKEFISDFQALLEVPFEVYGRNNFLYPLKNGFFNAPLNEKLKNKLVGLFGSTKEKLIVVLEKCKDFQEDQSNIMAACTEMDKETTALIDLLMSSADEIAALCYSDEFKEQCLNLLDNRERITKIVKALTFRFLSETILDDALNRPRGEFNPFESVAFHFASSYISRNIVSPKYNEFVY